MSANQDHLHVDDGASKENESFQRIKEQIDWYARQVLLQRDNILKVDDAVINAQRKLMQGRNSRMFSEDSQEQAKKLEKQIRILERRLNQALMKFNEKIAYNKQVRGKIDERRRERVVYDRIYTNIERELLERTIEMKEIAIDGSKAMKERDKYLNDVDVLRQQVAETLKSLRDDEQELKELLERQENEHKTEEEGLNNERMQPEKALALTIAKVRAGYNKPTTELPDDDPKVQLLDSHSDVKDDNNFRSADSVDVDAMLASFLEAEEKKFSILNHISELSLEKEQTEKDILRLSREIETLTRTNFHQYNFSPGVCRNIRETKTKLCDSQEKSRVVESELSSLKAAIKDVYGQLNCESFIPGSQLVLGEAVTDSNVMQFLAIIEQVSSALVVVIIKSSVFEVVPKPHISLLSEILPAVCC
jgi:chromosome segregation ATPase